MYSSKTTFLCLAVDTQSLSQQLGSMAWLCGLQGLCRAAILNQPIRKGHLRSKIKLGEGGNFKQPIKIGFELGFDDLATITKTKKEC